MNWNVILFSIYEVIVILAIIHVILDNRQPAKTMAWALVIWFVPFVGIVFYLFFGINTRKERYVSDRTMNMLTKRSMLEFAEQQNLKLPERYKPLIDLFVNQNLSLPFKDNEVEVCMNGTEFFPSLLRDIAQAKSHIHIDMYIIADDALGLLVADALIDKAREGVEVRLIYDDVGCWNVKHRFFERMREEGIEAVPFMPVHFPQFTSKVNYRNHRKIIVIDGQVGYIGGMNIALRYARESWRDTMLRVTGGGVYALQRAFLVDWYFVDRSLLSDRKYYPSIADATLSNDTISQVVTSGPVTPYPEIMQGYVRIIMGARRYLYIETPYFLPNESVLFALKTAALAGVDVKVLCPMHSDARFVEWASRSYLREVVEAGVQVSLYKEGFLHSKLLVCDDAIATCGSTNLDFRSFENNFEANIFYYGEDVALKLKEVFLKDMEQSVLLTSVPSRVSRKIVVRLWESLTRMLSPLF
ncbi:cardiolipin synthase [Prevotella sp. ne3005]|uniref:cardiolipin synthase n=1 Tax=Prevotella sp. ne3005 TaxID=1761887 RepID=UPI0008B6311E|nr:cardiolipin synthase [Prevotella sp. ne3005]SEN37809.1 cardiolipin synthase [Prevotella sp. ne3005]